MARFVRSRDTITARLDGVERRLLSSVMEELADLLGEGRPALPTLDAPATPTTPGGAPSAAELEKLVGLGNAGRPPSPPKDPALARLLPDAYRQDPELSGEFRRFTEPELRAGKRAAALAVTGALTGSTPVRLDGPAADQWLTALTDARLVLGTRLDIRTDAHEELDALDPDDPRAPAAYVFEWLGELQYRLLDAIGDPPPHH